MESDAAYFSRRAEQEFRSATESKDPAVRRARFDRAARYNDLAHEIREQELSLERNHREPVAAVGLWL